MLINIAGWACIKRGKCMSRWRWRCRGEDSIETAIYILNKNKHTHPRDASDIIKKEMTKQAKELGGDEVFW